MAHRLAQRAAYVLQFYDYKALEVFQKIKQAYSIRSSFVHGSFIEEKDMKSAPELCEAIMQYARIALSIFLQRQITTHKQKKSFLESIDEALLDSQKAEEIRKQLATELIVTK